jgi:integrase/recombinase XerD
VTAQEGTTTETLLEAWATYMRSESKSKNTLDRLTSTVRRFGATLDHDILMATSDEIAAWLEPFSPGTRLPYFNDLKAFFGWAELTGRTDRQNPMGRLRRPRCPKRAPKPVDSGILAKALEAAVGDLRTWIILGAYAALRVSEIVAVRGEHISDGRLLIRGKGDVEAFIPAHPLVLAEAETRPRHGWWFPAPRRPAAHVSTRAVQDRVTMHFRQFGVHVTPHQLRHWAATTMLQEGADLRQVQEFLRHATVATTESYTRVAQVGLKAAVNRLPGGDLPEPTPPAAQAPGVRRGHLRVVS